MLSVATLLALSGLGQRRHPANATNLPASSVTTRALSSGETHRYTIDLGANEFFQARVEQKGIDVLLRLSDPSGKLVAMMDSPNGTRGSETLSFVSPIAGRYLFEVLGREKRSERGLYVIERERSRSATAQDLRRVEVERTFVEGINSKDVTKAVMRLDSALAGWRELGDRYMTEMTSRQVKQIKANKLYDDAIILRDEETEESKSVALQKLTEARDLYLELGDNAGEADALLEIADIAKNLGDPETALKSFERALAQFRTLGDKSLEATTLNNIGLFYHQVNERDKALSYYLQSLILLRRLVQRPEEIITLNNIGVIYFQINHYQKSARYLQQALALSKFAKDKPGEARTLDNLGHLYLTSKDYQKAIQYFRQSLPIRRALGDKVGEVRVLEDIARAKSDQETQNLQKSPPLSNMPLPIGRSIERIVNSSYQDHIYRLTLKKGQALRVDAQEKGANVGLRLFRVADNQMLLSIDLSTGFARETLSYVAEQAGDYLLFVTPPEASMGGTYQLTGSTKEVASMADEMRTKAVRLLSEARDSFENGDLTGYQNATAMWGESLTLWAKLGESYWQGYTNNYLGVTSFQLGNKKEAIDHYDLALSFERASGDNYGEAITLSNIGTVYQDVGEKQQALKYYLQSLPLFKVIDSKKDEAINLSNIGSIYVALNKSEEALKYYEQALPLFQAVHSKVDESTVLNNIGGLYEYRGEKQKALRYYDEALAIAKELKDAAGEAKLLNNIGSIEGDERDGNPLAAFVSYTQSLRLARTTGNKRIEALVFFNMMRTWLKHGGSRRNAILFAKQSVNKCQELRAAAQGLDTEAQKSFLRDLKRSYKELAELLIWDGQLEQAVQVLDFYQDQRFFDFARTTRAPAPQVPLSAREQEYAALYETAGDKIAYTQAKIDELEQQIGDRKPTEQEAAQSKALHTELRSDLDVFLTFILDVDKQFTKPPDEKDKIPALPDVTEMQSALRELGVTTGQRPATVYTLIGAGRERLYLLLVTADQIRVFESPINVEQFQKKVWQFYALLQSPNYDPRVLGEELYGTIFKPLEEEVKSRGIQTLMWSLEDVLRYIPIAALWDGQKYLVERYQNVVLTRTDRERLTRKVSPVWTGTAFGSSREQEVELPAGRISFPVLPGVKKELQSIFGGSKAEGVLKGEVLSEAEFTEAAFYEAMKKRRPVVHISSHFSLQPGDEYRSFLLLGSGKPLTLASLKKQTDLFQGVELLTLSACETAAQRPDDNGREIDALAELAQRLGAGSVLASLWKVRDLSTAQLMMGFYKNRQIERLNKAQALRLSQLDLLYGKNGLPTEFADDQVPALGRSNFSIEDVIVEDKYRVLFKRDQTKPFAHPYFWSPFILFGNWQ